METLSRCLGHRVGLTNQLNIKLDVSAAYPNNECVFNVSKETTRKELTSMEGVNLYTQKMQTINLSGGHTNAVEWCTTLHNFPQLTSLLENFNQESKV